MTSHSDRQSDPFNNSAKMACWDGNLRHLTLRPPAPLPGFWVQVRISSPVRSRLPWNGGIVAGAGGTPEARVEQPATMFSRLCEANIVRSADFSLDKATTGFEPGLLEYLQPRPHFWKLDPRPNGLLSRAAYSMHRACFLPSPVYSRERGRG